MAGLRPGAKASEFVGEGRGTLIRGPGGSGAVSFASRQVWNGDQLAARLLVVGAKGVARERGLSLRTLFRRLSARGQNVRAVVLEYRRERTLRLLAAGVPIGEIALVLGFSGSDAFAAFCRWAFGMPARQLRARLESCRNPPGGTKCQ